MVSSLGKAVGVEVTKKERNVQCGITWFVVERRTGIGSRL